MLDEVKRTFRRLVRKAAKHKPGHREDHEVRIPEESQPGGPGRADEAEKVSPPHQAAPERGDTSNGDDELVSAKEKRHDGYADIRPRRPGEDTDMGRDIVPDITMPGRDLRPPEDEEQGKDGAS